MLCPFRGRESGEKSKFYGFCRKRFPISEDLLSQTIYPADFTPPAKNTFQQANAVTEKPNIFKPKARWLFAKNGFPTLVTLVIGFVVGFLIDGAVGVVLATILGLMLLRLTGKFRLPIKPYTVALSLGLSIVAQLCFLMVLLLPVTDSYLGLALPTGEGPNTLMKYCSIVVAKPENLVLKITDPYPGIPIVVLVSVVLMFLGSLNLFRKRYFAFGFAGLLLFTLSPIIGSAAIGRSFQGFFEGYLAFAYYLGWIGLALAICSIMVSRYHISHFQTISLVSIIPAFLIFSHVELSGSFPVTLQLAVTFEAFHHAVAGFFAGIVASLGAGSIVARAQSTQSAMPNETIDDRIAEELRLQRGLTLEQEYEEIMDQRPEWMKKNDFLIDNTPFKQETKFVTHELGGDSLVDLGPAPDEPPARAQFIHLYKMRDPRHRQAAFDPKTLKKLKLTPQQAQEYTQWLRRYNSYLRRLPPPPPPSFSSINGTRG